jgi:hypothetical protein
MVALLVLAVPAGVLGISQTAQAQLGEDIANSVLDSVFGTNADDGTEEEEEEEGATETEEEVITGDDNQDIDQTQEQTNDQDQTANQPITQESSQDETNEVANDLHTGDNTATVAQPNDATQEVTAASSADDNDASAKASAENDDDGDHHKKGKKHDGHYSGSSDSTSDDTTSVANADAIVDAAAEATGIVDQNNSADVDQDSSVHDVDLSNNVAFAEDTNTQIAVPISDQDQRAANLAEQRAANLDVEENEVVPYGFTITPTGEVVDCFPPSGATPPPFCG